jgi:ubiquitin C-terminal hydrolase
MSLPQCLQMFIEPEVLGPDDKWYCSHCKQHIQAEKRMSIWRLPPVLIVHLKRFKYNSCSSTISSLNSREKINTTVKFPTQYV